MYKVIVKNEEDQKYVKFIEYALHETHLKLTGAKLIYGNQLIDYLVETNQTELLMDAISGRLDEGSIKMDKDTYDRIYGGNPFKG